MGYDDDIDWDVFNNGDDESQSDDSNVVTCMEFVTSKSYELFSLQETEEED